MNKPITDLVEELGTASLAGHNQPPAELTPYDEAVKKIDALYAEISAYLDGEPIKTDGQANDVATLKRMIQAAGKAAEDMRVAEKAEPLELCRVIDAAYKPLSDKVKRAVDVCKQVETAWLKHKQKLADEEAARLRAIADAELAAAQEAIRQRDMTNLASVEAAEEQLKAAQALDRQATKAEATPVGIKTGAGRASSLRTYWLCDLADVKAFGAYAWTHHRDEYTAFLAAMAKRLVDDGARELPGCIITEDKRSV